MRFGSTAKVLAECKLKYYRISECMGASLVRRGGCLGWGGGGGGGEGCEWGSCADYLEEVLEHASFALRVLSMLHPGGDLVQGIAHAWILLAKVQAVDCVADVEVGGLEGHKVMHMHGSLLEGLPWRKMKVSSHLHMARCQSGAGCRALEAESTHDNIA